VYLTDDQVGKKIQTLLGDTPQRELADAVGVGTSVLSRALTGQRRFDLGELVAIAGFLGIEPTDLIADDAPVFAMRTNAADPEAVTAAIEDCTGLIDDFLTYRALAGK
jgi:transcriptional regulator with XRE-family HTH domain